MATKPRVPLKKPPDHASDAVLVDTIRRIAIDKRKRVLLTDQNAWLETRLKEIARLARVILRRSK